MSVVDTRDNHVEEITVDQHYITQRYTVEALNFIDKNIDKSFFLYLAHSIPHIPIYASENFNSTSERGLIGDAIQELDWSVGKIIKKVEGEGLLKNTLFIFTSDNGPCFAMKEPGDQPEISAGVSFFTFEGGMRVTAAAMWNGDIPPGQVCAGMISMLDWFPTIFSFTGAKTLSNRPVDRIGLLRDQGFRY